MFVVWITVGLVFAKFCRCQLPILGFHRMAFMCWSSNIVRQIKALAHDTCLLGKPKFQWFVAETTFQPILFDERYCHCPRGYHVDFNPYSDSSFGRNHGKPYWLVVYLPLWKIWVRQLGWWHSQYVESHKKPCSEPPTSLDSHRPIDTLHFLSFPVVFSLGSLGITPSCCASKSLSRGTNTRWNRA